MASKSSTWYQVGPRSHLSSLPLGRPVAVYRPAPAITKHHAVFAEKSKKKKRVKDYSSDSSASEKETENHSEGRIYRAPKGSGKEFYVYHQGKKISFGDPNMKNRNNEDGARANFMARHNCAEKKDKSKAGYWACRVWRKGYKGPSSGGEKKG